MAFGFQAGQLYVPITLDQTKFDSALRGVEAKLKQTEASLKGFADVGKRLESVGKGFSLYVTAPIAALGAVAVKSSIDLESAFAGVRKTVDATEEQFAELRKGFVDMSKEIPIATTELFGIGEAAGQLGIKREHILEFSEVMAKLGVTTNMSSTEAATALARLANITGMSMDNVDRLGSAIVALGNSLATTEAEIVQMGLRLAGAGKQVGLTEAQILSFSGALSSVGIRAEAGGTAFSKVMLEINNQVMGTGENLQLLAQISGMSADQFAQQWEEDAAGAILAFVQGLGDMQKQGENVMPLLEELGFSGDYIRDSLLRASGSSDKFANSLEVGSKAWQENIALNKEAEERFKTTASQLTLLKNNLGYVASTFGDILLPVINRAIQGYLIPLLDKIDSWDESTKRTAITIAGLAAVIGPTLILLGKLSQAVIAVNAVSALTGPLMAKISAALIGTTAAAGGATVALGASGTAMLATSGAAGILGTALSFLAANPIVLVVGAVVGLIAWFVKLSNQAKKTAKEIDAAGKEMAGSISKSTYDATVAMYEAEEATKNATAVMSAGVNDFAVDVGGTAGAVGKAAGTIASESEKMSDRVRAALDRIGLQQQILRAEYDLSIAKMGEAGNRSEKLRAQLEMQEQELELTEQKVNVLSEAYELVKQKKGETAQATMELQLQLLEARKAQEGLKQSIADTTKEMQGQINVGKNLLDVLDARTTYYPGSGAIVKSSKSAPMTDLQKWAWGRLAELQKMADGGMIYKPTLLSDLTTGKPYAIAGEAGPEAVLPMTRGGQGAVQQQTVADIDYDRLGAAVARHAKPSITQNNKIIAQQPLSPAAVVREENKLLQRLGMAMG